MYIGNINTSVEQPQISVVISTFNYGRFLGEAIESVLLQSYNNVEVIVSDDGSTDDTEQVVRSFGKRIRYHFQQNLGIAECRNSGLALASANYFAFLDADDHWELDKLSLQIRKFQDEPELDIVFGHARQYFSPEVSNEFKSRKCIRREVIAAPLSSSMLIKRLSFERVGAFRTLPVAVDQDWYMRSVDIGLKSHMLDDVLFHRRIHENNNGVRASKEDKRARLSVIKDALDRRRVNKSVPDL